MSVEVNIYPERDSDNTNPATDTFYQDYNGIHMILCMPDRKITISKEDWKKLILVLSPINPQASE